MVYELHNIHVVWCNVYSFIVTFVLLWVLKAYNKCRHLRMWFN